MDKDSIEMLISYLLSVYADYNSIEVKDIKAKSDRTDSIWQAGGRSYLVEITHK